MWFWSYPSDVTIGLHLYIPLLWFVLSTTICVFLSFIFANVLCLHAILWYFDTYDVALYLYILSLCYCVLCYIHIFLVIKIITHNWLLYYSHFYLLCMFVLFKHRCQFNGIWCDCHVRAQASFKTRFNPPFSTYENACPK